MLRFDDYQVGGVRVNREFPRRVLQREADLIEHRAEFLKGENPKRVRRNGHDPLRTLFGTEARGEFQTLVGQWR